MTNCKMYTIDLNLLSVNCVFVVFFNKQANCFLDNHLLGKQANCFSPFRRDGREGGKKVLHYCLVLVTDPLYLPLKRGGLVCPYFESPRKLYKSLSASLFGKQANCLSPFRGDGRGVKIHMKKCLFHVSRHITNLFLETRNMRKQ